MARPSSRLLAAALCACSVASDLVGQAAVDPSVAPRALQLARAGARTEATEMLGRYLATAPDDAAAWRALGWFYLVDARQWHGQGHVGDPTGALFLDFAGAALDQALRGATDSALLLRATVDRERMMLGVEARGWALARAAGVPADAGSAPDYVRELGLNLIASCPAGGVMVTGTDLEATAVWSVVFGEGARADLVLLLPEQYAGDSLYRSAMVAALGVATTLPVDAALAEAAQRRPVCLSPGVPATIVPAVPLATLRLVRVGGRPSAVDPAPLSIVDLLEVELARPNAVEGEVLAVYQAAARANPLLCTTLLLPLRLHHRTACRD